eukprot:Gb_27547 [translate_table: standard]
MAEAKVLELKSCHRKIYINKGKDGSYEYKNKVWTPVVFYHLATFDALALKPEQKKDIIEDLQKFKNRENYYKKVGRAWKRGYFLYRPPSTGKSSMITTIANFLQYDIYDLELTEKKSKKNKEDKAGDAPGKSENGEEESRVTLFGVLNFTDGLWSCCGSERLIIFTTNHIDRLNLALLPSDQMDKHIHLSFCTFLAFKVLAYNYLGIQHHSLFEDV